MRSSIHTLTKRRQFLAMPRDPRFVRPAFILLRRMRDGKLPDDASAPPGSIGIGYTATKKLGNAVVRNRVKRRLRAAVAETFPQHAEPGCDYVLIGREQALTQGYDALLDDLRFALRRLPSLATPRAS